MWPFKKKENTETVLISETEFLDGLVHTIISQAKFISQLINKIKELEAKENGRTKTKPIKTE